MPEQQYEPTVLPDIEECSDRELYVHVLAELVKLYVALGVPVNIDMLNRLNKLAEAAGGT
jgi:hypothetical protein